MQKKLIIFLTIIGIILGLGKANITNAGLSPSWCHDFGQNLKFGDQGEEVMWLQNALQEEGFTIFTNEKQNAQFGYSTASAIVGFQEKYASEILQPLDLGHGTGYVGPKTRAKLNALYGCPQPSITVLSPNGGERWESTKSYRISWKTAGNLYSQVDILLGGFRKNGTQIDNWKLIEAGIPTKQGYFYWAPGGAPLYVPSSFSEIPAKYKIKIREATDRENALFDISDSYFSIVSSQQEDPVSGTLSVDKTQAKVGENINLTISAQDDQGIYKVMAYYQGRWHTQYCNNTTECTKTFTFTESTPGTKYYYGYVYGKKLNGNLEGKYTEPASIKVTVTTQISQGVIMGVVRDSNNNPISGATVTTLLYPATTCHSYGIATTDSNGNYRISNLSSGFYVLKASKAGYTISSPTSTNCPSYYESKYGKGIVCISLGAGNCGFTQEQKTANFVLSPQVTPSITVLSPNGGERWEIGKTYTIRWTSEGVDKVLIELEEKNQGWHLAYNVNASMGQYNWSVPNNLTPNNDYKIKVIGQGNAAGIEDSSDNYFSIVSSQQEDPVSGTLSVDKTQAKVGENINLTISAQDDQGIYKVMAYYQGRWHTQYCNNTTECTKTFTFTESTPGTKYYYGYVYGKKLNGNLEGKYTTPSYVKVKWEEVTPTCTDSDGGKNYYKKGTVRLGSVIRTDYCRDANTVAEYWCSGMGGVEWIAGPEYYQCPYGCENGACKKVQPKITVISPNGGEKWEIGSTQIIKWKNSSNIRWVSIVLWAANKPQVEESQIASYALTPGVIDASRGYFRWKIDPTEIGINFSQYKYYKIAIDGYTEEPEGLPGQVAVRDVSDSYFTVTKPITCTDSDGGKNYYKKGTVTVNGLSYTDYCLDGNRLIEYYCSNNQMKFDTYTCSYGCENGACRKQSACERKAPTVTIKPSSSTHSPGDYRGYGVYIKNNDSQGCGVSTFTLTKRCPSGWTCTLSRSSVTISPGATYGVTLGVTSSQNASPGTYRLTVTAQNQKSGLSGEGQAKYIVKETQQEDPVSGTLSVDKTQAKVGENINLTISAQDDQGIYKVMAYYQGRWHTQYCNNTTECTKTFTFTESTPGTKYYYGYVYGKKLNGNLEGKYTTPSYVKVKWEEEGNNLPDLVVEDIYYESPYIKVKYCNRGNGWSSSDFLIKLINNKTGKSYGGNSFYRFNVPQPGKCKETGGYTSSLIGLSYGEKASVTAVIDWEKRVPESNENNNNFTKTIGMTTTLEDLSSQIASLGEIIRNLMKTLER